MTLSFPQLLAPPRARVEPRSHILHGELLEDPYAWLRAANWQDVMRNPEVLEGEIRQHLEAENRYTETMLAPTKTLRETLVREMRGRLKEEDESVPVRDGIYEYFTSYEKGHQHPSIWRRHANDETELLLNAHAAAEPYDFFRLGYWRHSPDHKYFAYSADIRGSEFYRITICKAGETRAVDEFVQDSTGEFIWSADGQSFFYVWRNTDLRPARVYRHIVGTPRSEDDLIYAENDAGFYLAISQTQSGRFLLIEPHDNETSETYLLDLFSSCARPFLLRPREKGIVYEIEHSGERIFILTNEGSAEDFKIMQAPATDPGHANWHPFLEHRPGRLILQLLAFTNHLVRLERESGLPLICITNLSSGAESSIVFSEESYDLELMPGYKHDTSILRFTYSSMRTPREIYDYDLSTQERLLRKRQEIPSGHNPAGYVTRFLRIPARDGALIPVSLLYSQQTPLDGSAPLLLYGYGSYGISTPAAFNSNRLSLVDRGFVYAIAHIRGGKECGYRWYTDGKRGNKKNTFTDYIDCARYLISERFTGEGRIVGHGGSAGGMLMGAVANDAPELFGAMIAEVPFVDVLNTMLDESLPLTPPEWQEWGDPIRDEKAFAYIRSYSPYDNVRTQSYPAILAMTGLTDPRVTYWEPAKWIARLRACASGGPFLLHTNMSAGHAGATGRFDRLEEVAIVYAFALMATGRATSHPTIRQEGHDGKGRASFR
jgi:oligopeptidase B